MSEIATIGLDFAEAIFHAHGADDFQHAAYPSKLVVFFADQPRCTVALEACGGAHHGVSDSRIDP